MPLTPSLPIEVIEIQTPDNDEDGSGLFSSPKAPPRPMKALERTPGDRERERKVVMSDDEDLHLPAPPSPNRRSGNPPFPLTTSNYKSEMTYSHSSQTMPRTHLEITWIPGQSNIKGNERVDTLAKEVPTIPILRNTTTPYALERRQFHNTIISPSDCLPPL
ncbi:hypothetical protein EDD17DRAFT_32408 [Pisolithus thermaeus]|nr:hypothetical protein EDD17DRAFT_32408 [Pisolithus thermaeus]